MASGYTLPTVNLNGESHSHAHAHAHVQHGHSRSYSGAPASYPSPNPVSANANQYLHSNGGHGHSHGVKKATSTGELYTHTESSREASPATGRQSWHTPYEQNTFAFDHNHSHIHTHTSNGHARSQSWMSPLKSGRARGESDLGRPADPRTTACRSTLERLDSDVPPASTLWFSLPEALTALLIPLPYMLASAAYSSVSGEELGGGTHELPAYARLQHGAGGHSVQLPRQKFSSDSGLIEACTLTSGTLLLVGILAKMRAGERVLDRRKPHSADTQRLAEALLSLASFQAIILRAVSLGLPFYAAMQIGGFRTGLVLLVAHAAGLTGADVPSRWSKKEWKHILSSRLATLLVIWISIIMDFTSVTFHAPFTHMASGYLALALSVLVLPLPLARSATGYRSPAQAAGGGMSAASQLTASTGDVNITLLAGLLLSMITVMMSMIWSIAPSIKGSAMIFSTLSIAVASAAIFFAQPHLLRNTSQAGLGLGCGLTACCAFLYSPSLWPGTICNGGLSALSFLGLLYDTNANDGDSLSGHDHDHAHTHHSHSHDHHAYGAVAGSASCSTFTKLLLNRCAPGSLLHGILSEKDSRRIAYFTVLNFGFMFVQGVYAYLSGSLGLLSDTVHMFFDCLGLVVGLGAAVASRFPPTAEKPFGWGKLNTLAGFGNGVFLMLVSVEFVWEAIEGIVEQTELRHVGELMVVSVAGLVVNLVGLLAFGHAHAHAGHDHGGHSHSHSNGHEHENDHSNNHSHTHSHNQTCDHNHKALVPHSHDHAHNENMHGIFLHVAADAGGSAAVIVSTALTLWKPSYLWDPLATIIIAVLIFAAAVPLVTASGRKLLLVVPEEMEYGIKNMLQELSEFRGVVGYAAPRFWVNDSDSAAAAEGHAHHGHDHGAAEGKQKVMGTIHILAAPSADAENVRERVEEFVRERGMDLVIHVEKEAEGPPCWCGGVAAKSG